MLSPKNVRNVFLATFDLAEFEEIFFTVYRYIKFNTIACFFVLLSRNKSTSYAYQTYTKSEIWDVCVKNSPLKKKGWLLLF